MAKPLLDDALQTIIEPHIPVKPRRFKHPGRKRVPDRACLTGIQFVLLTGIQWETPPKEMGCGCGEAADARIDEWESPRPLDNGLPFIEVPPALGGHRCPPPEVRGRDGGVRERRQSSGYRIEEEHRCL